MGDSSQEQEKGHQPANAPEEQRQDQPATPSEEQKPEVTPSGGWRPEDVLLDIPELTVDTIELEVSDLRAHVSLVAEVLNLVKLNVGVDATLGKVDLDIRGVRAQALLKVRLEKVAEIVDGVVAMIDNHPEIVQDLVKGAGQAIGEVGRGAGQALPQVGQGAGQAVQQAGQGAGQALPQLGQGAGQAAQQVGQGAGQAAQQVGQGAGQALPQVGQGAGQATQQAGQAGGQALPQVGQGAGQAAQQAGQAGGQATQQAGQGVPDKPDEPQQPPQSQPGQQDGPGQQQRGQGQQTKRSHEELGRAQGGPRTRKWDIEASATVEGDRWWSGEPEQQQHDQEKAQHDKPATHGGLPHRPPRRW